MKVLNAVWYATFTGNVDLIGIVKVDDGFEIKYYIGTGNGKDEYKDIKRIIEYGDRFYPGVFKERE